MPHTTAFLEHVARDLHRRYGDDLSQLTIVFPNKRASLFLNEHLARLAGRPLWSPAYITISDLFRAVPTDWGTGGRRPMRQRFQG